MADWEDEMENVESVVTSTPAKTTDLESETIIKAKPVEQKPVVVMQRSHQAA